MFLNCLQHFPLQLYRSTFSKELNHHWTQGDGASYTSIYLCLFPGGRAQTRGKGHPGNHSQQDSLHPFSGRLPSEQTDPSTLPGLSTGPGQRGQPGVAANVWSAGNSGSSTHTYFTLKMREKAHLSRRTQSVVSEKIINKRLADIIDMYYHTACLFFTPYFTHSYLWSLIKCKQLKSICIYRYWFLVHMCPSVWKTWRDLLTTQVLQEHPSHFLLVTSFFILDLAWFKNRCLFSSREVRLLYCFVFCIY